ncbi:hypothetical protein BDV25DRAFT_169381 [Aspergillus avenaceus]|uniref:FAD-binding PCMH-type domain-containing protein n=1 Tax=Aspergillus avenaceus TaxID=36643 RepID=A0A5N6TLD5_ASPAV|nr:hypothetical protein BDV25DRAFT_169381 [Aspergillus avenaceus]
MADFVATLKKRRVPVHLPGELDYERSVATSNLLYRFSRPDCVVQPEVFEHVQTVIIEAKRRNKKIIIKNGGHSYAGFSTAQSESISLDLARLNRVEISEDRSIVTMEGGAKWGHAYKELINGHHDGYIINGGRCPSVGVSGFILGGGLSPFTRSFGMGCDTLKEATIVTADGTLVTVSDEDDPTSDKGRLFWALCGAGGGNFGVVVELKLRVQKLPSGGDFVVAGRYNWYPKQDEKSMGEFMDTMNDFYSTKWPTSITIDSSWLCDLEKDTSELGVRFITYFDGSKPEFDNVIDTYVKQKDLSKQLIRRSLQEKSTRFLHETLEAQWSEETQKAKPSGSDRPYAIYTSFVFKDTKKSKIQEITSTIREEMKAFRNEFAGEKALLQVTFIHSGGKASERKRSATAFRWRDCVYHAYIMIEWAEKWLEMDMRGFCQKMKEKLKPFSMMKRASFINFPDNALVKATHERVYYGNNRQELQRIKQIWDQENFFDWSQGVQLPPASLSLGGSARAQGAEDDDELASGDADEPPVDEQALTDRAAGDQWDNFTPPSEANSTGYQAIQAIQALIALGIQIPGLNL